MLIGISCSQNSKQATTSPPLQDSLFEGNQESRLAEFPICVKCDSQLEKCYKVINDSQTFLDINFQYSNKSYGYD